MYSEDNTQVWAKVRKETKERLETLKSIDKVLYSESRVVQECIDAHLPKVEARAQPFKRPIQDPNGPRTRTRR
jgi:hypothetical protein